MYSGKAFAVCIYRFDIMRGIHNDTIFVFGLVFS